MTTSARAGGALPVPGTGPLLQLRGVERSFGTGRAVARALRGVDLDVAAGSLVALRGRSGSGKTTLLNVIGGLDRADAGTVVVAGCVLGTASDRELLALRRQTVGFVFQSFGLIPTLTAAENIGLPLRLLRSSAVQRRERADELLDRVGLAQHAHQLPGELSGGQQQRVALARALAHRPRLLIADEPTGQLDSETGRDVMRLLREVVAEQDMTALVATHDAALMEDADRVVELRDGRIATPDPFRSPGAPRR